MVSCGIFSVQHGVARRVDDPAPVIVPLPPRIRLAVPGLVGARIVLSPATPGIVSSALMN
ncbi:hypothetical protein N656DRAFT_780695 [Canariomyces notabilis]|uniref:Uncharacterized protein n=1 Tax=Canariomyces notabilis TaxID=2074819 RepID=A0AAN6TBP8_9PEZI|nr:hypothetical protein N656DRAFT_780695 [Canariomyces arenarius]